MQPEQMFAMSMLIMLAPFALVSVGVVLLIVWHVYSAIFLEIPKEMDAVARRKGHKQMAQKGKEKLKGDYYD